jgi:hypothetical protein
VKNAFGKAVARRREGKVNEDEKEREMLRTTRVEANLHR